MDTTTIQNTFTKPEIYYFLNCLNGVICEPDTLINNLLAGWEYFSMENVEYSEVEKKLRNLECVEILDLYTRLNKFWDVEGYYIADTETRAREVGLF